MFTKNTQILDYSPHSQQRWRTRQYLLCPVLSYRIIVPITTSKEPNFLEKAILNLNKIGAYTADELGEIIEIDPQLAALIVSQLIDQKYLDNQGKLTQKGEKVLEGIVFQTEEMIAGYIFQNPITGELYPRFLQQLNYAETKRNQSGFPDLVYGTTGKPKYERAFMPLPIDNPIISQPSAQEILKAIHGHNKSLRNQDSYDEEENYAFPKNQINKVSFIEEEATPFWVTTYLYIPENQTEENEWYVCDPFGLGDSIWLQRRLEKQIKNSQPESLNHWFRNFLKQGRETVSDHHWEEYQSFQKQLQDDAKFLVEEKLTLVIKDYDQIFQQLVSMEKTNLEIEALQNSENIPKDKLEEVMIKAQKVAETVLIQLGKDYPTQGNCHLLSEANRLHNRTLIQEIANTLNFNKNLPKTLTDVKPGKVKNVAETGHGSLRPLLLATLFTAAKQPSHPLRNVATQNPNLLIELDTLAKLRDQSSHSNQHSLTLEQVSTAVQTIYQFVSLTFHCPLNN